MQDAALRESDARHPQSSRRPSLIHVERHRQGPRVFVAGRRIHEVTVGAALAAVLLVGYVADMLRPSAPVFFVALAAGWMIAKDWRDAVPSLRDSGSWQLGIHRRFSDLRTTRRSDGLPVLAALAALIAAGVNIASTLTPDVPSRARLLLQLEPVLVPSLAHAAALPTGAALAVVALCLFRRRRRALYTAVALLVVLGCLDILKGLDVEEAVLSWACAGVLWWGRDAFCVQHDPLRQIVRLWRIAAVWVGAVALAAVAVWGSTYGHGSPADVLRQTGAMLVWSDGPLSSAENIHWLGLGLGALGLIGLLAGATVLFRPLALPKRADDAVALTAAVRLVRAYGSDTLAFFKLRRDNRHFFSADGLAFLAYKISGRILLISGDPVGRASSVPGLLSELCEFAEHRGLALGAIGVGSEYLDLYRDAGMQALYIGDEAIVETGGFTLQGRAIRKVRQSVNRLEAAGFTCEVLRLDDLDSAAIDELEHLSDAWRCGAPERGFAMAMDGLACSHGSDTVVVVARDDMANVRGFLHFVPTYGRPAMSLSLMCRSHETPNGLVEFLIVRAIDDLRARGIREISLNFAAFARWMHEPRTRAEHILGRLVALANPYFQIEGLYRFSNKFAPRWEPRHLLYERTIDLPRIALATMRVEGQLPVRPRPTPRTTVPVT